MQQIKKIYLLLLFICLSLSVMSHEKIVITDAFTASPIANKAEIYVDKTAKLSLNGILTPEINREFTENLHDEPYFGYGKQAVWVRFSVTNNAYVHKICYVSYSYPIIRNVSVYQFGLNNTVDSAFAGYAIKAKGESASNARPIFKIHLLPSEIKTVYMRFENGGTEFPLPLELQSEVRLLNSNEYSQLLYGIMYGLVLFIILVNGFLFINLKKRIYPFFVLYVLAVGFYFSIRDGFAFKYFWDYSLWLSSQSIFFGAQLPNIFLLTLTQNALKTKQYMPRLHKVFQLLIVINATLIVFAFFFKIPPYVICNVTILISIVPIMIASVKALPLKKMSLPKYFLASQLFLSSGIALLLLKNFGVVDYITGELALRTGFVLQLIALTFGLTAMFKNILNDVNKQAISNLEKLNELKDQVNLELETQVEERTEELAQKNKAITAAMRELGVERDIFQVQRDMIKRQTDETMDSIKYAERLQNNLSKSCTHLLDSFEGYFILNKPKAIVSGDFYWVKRENNKVIIAVADCTGHGVPGAFMSVLGITYLNDIISYDHEPEPAKILELLRTKVIESFSGGGSSEGIAKDGMDIALIAIDTDTLELEYAGAYNPLYVVRKTDLLTFAGDRMPISVHEHQNIPFTNHKIQLQREDNLYLFSDGYVDQFGWRTGKKFKHKQFKQLVLELNDVPIEGQKMVLERTLNNWMGDLEQIDDIMVMGLKI